MKLPIIVYRYMITYNFQNGTGRMDLNRKHKIKTFEDLRGIDDYLFEKNGFKCCVSHYKLLNRTISLNGELQ